tara:strand:- start:2259 stop:2621 length:363 start_codon:yes stop_codon:yes gene_type:complete
MTAEQLFDSIGVRLSTTALRELDTEINWTFSDLGEHHVLGISNCAIHHLPDRHTSNAAASVVLTRHVLADTLGGIISFSDAFAQGDITIEGDESVVLELFDLLTEFLLFPIIEPHGDQEM